MRESGAPVGAHAQADDAWRAELALGFTLRAGRTCLERRRALGPLYVQKPFYPETPGADGAGPVHVYLLHPPGGVAAQDDLTVSVAVAERAGALLTTPAATKLYRSAGPTARLEQIVEVAAGGSCEWLPQENIYFSGTRASLDTRVQVAPGGRFFGWDVHCLGRPASGDHFSGARVGARFRLLSGSGADAVPLLFEHNRWCSDAEALRADWGQAGFPVSGAAYALPFDEEQLEHVRRRVDEGADERRRCSLSLVDGVLVARVLASSAELARRWVEAVWAASRPVLLGREACPPRIWAT